MSEPDTRPRSKPALAVSAWRRFWFGSEPTYALGLARMAFGVLAVAWTVSLLADLHRLFGPRGVVPRRRLGEFQWSVFDIWSGDGALVVGWCVLLVSAIALTVGWHSRLAAVLVFVLMFSFHRENPWIVGGGDVLLRIEALLLALSPCGSALSLDQHRLTGSFSSAQARAVWPIRLMQLQLSLIYLGTVQFKISGDTWLQGTAVSYALRLQDMMLLPTPDWVTANALLMNTATWATLALEFAIGILVWNRRCRPWVLAGGVVMHMMIMSTIAVGFFNIAMFVLYLVFVPPAIAQRVTNRVTRFRGRHPTPTNTHERDNHTPVEREADRVDERGVARPISTS
jgi:Vitamin K-dependent gamma-carboxylase